MAGDADRLSNRSLAIRAAKKCFGYYENLRRRNLMGWKNSKRPAVSPFANGIFGTKFENWAETFSCAPALYFEPEDRDELRSILQEAMKRNCRVHVIGSLHSPSDIAFTDDFLVSLKKFPRHVDVDFEMLTATAPGGMLISDLNKILDGHGMALSVLPSVSDITIAGAISTATHGTGTNFGLLSTYASELEIMTADGEILFCSETKNQAIFKAGCCGIGCLGVIITIKLQCEKSFSLLQVQKRMHFQEVMLRLKNGDDLTNAAEHFRFVWYPHTDDAVCFYSNRVPFDTAISNRDLGETIWSKFLYWLRYILVGHYFLELSYYLSTYIPKLVPRINKFYSNWLHTEERDKFGKSFDVFNFDCLFKQRVNEWAVPKENAAGVLSDLKNWLDVNPQVVAHFPVEVRFVKADDVWLSPAYDRDVCYINIIMYCPFGKQVPYRQYWDAYEQIMLEANGRPHWAKAHKVSDTQFVQMYPKFEEFCYLRHLLDPNGLFLNVYLWKVLAKSTLIEKERVTTFTASMDFDISILANRDSKWEMKLRPAKKKEMRKARYKKYPLLPEVVKIPPSL